MPFQRHPYEELQLTPIANSGSESKGQMIGELFLGPMLSKLHPFDDSNHNILMSMNTYYTTKKKTHRVPERRSIQQERFRGPITHSPQPSSSNHLNPGLRTSTTIFCMPVPFNFISIMTWIETNDKKC